MSNGCQNCLLIKQLQQFVITAGKRCSYVRMMTPSCQNSNAYVSTF